MGINNKFREMLLGNVPLGKETEYYYDTLLPKLEKYNRADTVNMTPLEMNDFRHLAGSKQTLNDLGFPRGIGALLYKEVEDLVDGLSLKDTYHDLKNDARAVKLYINNRGLADKELNDYVFNNYIQPERNNK